MNENYVDEARGIEAEYHADLAAEREQVKKLEAELAKLEQLANGWILKNNASWQGESDLPAFFEARLHQLAIAGRAMLDAEKRVARLEEVLEMVEWSGEYPYDPCFWCNANRKDGHKSDCKRQEALEGNK